MSRRNALVTRPEPDMISLLEIAMENPDQEVEDTVISWMCLRCQKLQIAWEAEENNVTHREE